MDMKQEIENLRARFEKHGQGHVFRYFDELESDASKRDQFLEQLRTVDVESLSAIFTQSVKSSTDTGGDSGYVTIEPPNAQDIANLQDGFTEQERRAMWDEGLQLIHKGSVGVLLLAGGQGTRLGFNLPKGMFVLDRLPSKKSLFQIQAERIVRLQQLAREKYGDNDNNGSNTIMWYVMTSEFTHDETVQHFEEHEYWGLQRDQVHFFTQGSIPCLDNNGAIILESKHKISLAPNGNGDVYRALEANGMLDHMEQHGVEHVHLYCVDNVLVKVADPVFVAFCARQQADFGTKVLPKRDPHERVGVFATKGGKYHVVEYSEISREMAERIDPTTGQLAFNAGNIANFYYTRKFLCECAQRVKTHYVYHVARKQIPFWDAELGQTVTPAEPNGVKLELFNFDICEYASKVALLQVDRSSEFSPLKNKSGSPADTPETCVRDLSALHVRYLEEAGAIVSCGPGPLETDTVCEISPLVTYAGEGLESVKGRSFTLPLHLDSLSLL